MIEVKANIFKKTHNMSEIVFLKKALISFDFRYPGFCNNADFFKAICSPRSGYLDLAHFPQSIAID